MHLLKPAIVSIAAIFLALTSLAQSLSPVDLPGTKCRLAAPPGFELSKTFSGFQNGKTGAFIMVNEIPAPVKTVTDGFSESAMKGRGMKLISTEKANVRDLTATMFIVTQESKGTTFVKYLLVFGQGEATTLVTAGYPEGSDENSGALKKAIATIECNPALVVDPLAAAPFTLNTDGTGFKPVKFVGGSLLYSMDGKIPTDKPIIIAGSSLGKTEVSSRKAFAEKRLQQLPGAEKAIIRQASEITIDSLAGYEIVAEGSGKEGNAALVYEVALFTEDGKYFLIVGQATERQDGLLETYRRIARSFKRK